MIYCAVHLSWGYCYSHTRAGWLAARSLPMRGRLSGFSLTATPSDSLAHPSLSLTRPDPRCVVCLRGPFLVPCLAAPVTGRSSSVSREPRSRRCRCLRRHSAATVSSIRRSASDDVQVVQAAIGCH